MRTFLILWLGPLVFLGAWYGLSYYDISFGYRMLTRQTHDLVFQIYGNVLGLPPESIPPLVFKALIVDSCLVILLIILKRRRKEIWATLRTWFGLSKKSEAQKLGDTDVSNADYSRIS